MIRTSLEGLQTSLEVNQQALKLTDRPVARWMNLGSVTRVGNGHRNIKHV